MDGYRFVGLVLASFSLLCTTNAEAHFRLVQPPSWLNEDSLGGPQKGSPCGPGNKMLIIGDDVQPVPLSNTVTTFQAGETIALHLEETVYHPGYFRVSLAHTKPGAATMADFPNPPLTDTVNCHYDTAAVQTVAHDNVLADGLFMAEGQEGTNRSLMQPVKLPSEPCDDCTLQVVQVMEGHPGSSCFYFHCAEIKIVAGDAAVPSAGDAAVPATGDAAVPASGDASVVGAGDAGRAVVVADAGAAVDAGRATEAGASHDAGASDTQPDSGGCAVGPLVNRGSPETAWCLFGAALMVVARRRRRRLKERERVAASRRV